MNEDRQWIFDLENHGIDGAIKLRQLLLNSTNILRTIADFQERNSVKKDNLEPAMKLLDILGVRRAEFHELAIADATEKILAKLKSLGSQNTKESILKLEKQLEKSFKLYRVPKMRPIILETLRQLPKVPDRYLKIIVADKEFYECCAMSVRQQIWLKNDLFYLEAVAPVIDRYIIDKNKTFYAIDQTSTNFFTSETTKSRRQWQSVQDLVAMVGDREYLYTRLIAILRDAFIKTKDFNFCSLRMEIVMAVHDNKVSVDKIDPCHDLAWCLDACVRDRHLDAQLTNKLKNILDSAKQKSAEVVGDLAMIAADVHVVHFLASMAVKILKDIAVQGIHLPREVQSLQLITRLLAFGSSAHTILNKKEFNSIHAVDSVIFTKFFAPMTSLIVEDVIRNELSRATDEFLDDHPLSSFCSMPSETIISFLKTDLTCALIWMYYAMEMLPKKRRPIDISGLNRYLQIFPKLKDKLAYRDPWAHLFVHRLLQIIPYANVLQSELIYNSIITDYLMNELEVNSAIKYHILRIINSAAVRIGETRILSLLEKISPEQLFEPGMVEDEDMKRYKTEYNRVHSKYYEKPNDTATSVNS